MKEHIFKIILLVIGTAVVAVACRPKPVGVIEPLKTIGRSCRLDP